MIQFTTQPTLATQPRGLIADCPGLKAGFTTRRVLLDSPYDLDFVRTPRPGDLVLARVDSIGQHDALQTTTGRRARIYPGDSILVCYGNRYAVNQWEAIVPPTAGPCDLVAAGGVAGRVLSRHAFSKRPTGLTPLGLLVSERGETLNLCGFALEEVRNLPVGLPPVLAVVGTSMDAGKTTSACALIRGLAREGKRVAGIKVTGTGACGDYFQMRDAGASWVADFVDAGFASTYKLEQAELLRIFTTLVGHAAAAGSEVIVAEVADGVVQRETALLLESEPIRRAVTAILLSASDPFGACAAARWLREAGLPVRAVCGPTSNSTLSAQETIALTELPVLGLGDLSREECASEWARL